MKSTLKICSGCNRSKVIWKNHKGKRFCKDCWSAKKPPSKKVIKKKSISPYSTKRKAENKEYSSKRLEFLKKLPFCEAHLNGCTIQSSELHHKKGRVGKLLIDERYFLSVCRSCHNFIENNPTEAKELGFSISRLTN